MKPHHQLNLNRKISQTSYHPYCFNHPIVFSAPFFTRHLWQIKSLLSFLLGTLADQKTTTANGTNGISTSSIIHVLTPSCLDVLPTNN